MSIRPQHVIVRYALAAAFMIFGHCVYAQKPVEPTSATDGEVKIHRHRNVFSFGKNKFGKKSGGQARIPERKGESIQKPKPHRNRTPAAKEARVFGRHNHFAKKETSTRARARSSKKLP